MYYNSHKSNSDYYNSYKKELSALEAYKKAERRELFLKIIASLFILLLLFLAAIYLYKYFNPKLDEKSSLINNKAIKEITIKEEELPISIQEEKNTIKITNVPVTENRQNVSKINEQDIALIVETVMKKINKKVEKPLEEQLNEADNQNFATKSLKEENHYNKVVLSQDENLESLSDSLETISSKLNTIIDEKDVIESNYTEEIQEEIVVRENEMRVIVVQQGDTLSKIAERAYGNYTDYTKIFAANPEIIKNPNQIFVGQRLRIPS